MITELLSSVEAAEVLHVSIHTLRAWGYQRRLPQVRLGRKVLYRREDLESFISKGVVGARDER